MKVLLVNTLYPPFSIGGAERSVRDLAQALDAAALEVEVLTLHDGPDERIDRDGDVRVRRLPLRSLYWPYDGRRRSAGARAAWHLIERGNLLMLGPVRRAIRDASPDVVHGHVLTGFSTSVQAAAKRLNLPLVLTLRDYSLICARSALFKRGRRCERRCAPCILLTEPRRRAAGRAEVMAAISRALLDRHRAHGLIPLRSVVLGNPVSGERTLRPSLEAVPVLTFGFIGRLEPEKGVSVLLDAVTGLEGPWRLLIAGQGDPAYVEALKRQAAGAPIVWTGAVEADRFYRDIDVLVAPAVWEEPFGRVVAEAAAYGRSVIASDIGGLPEAAAGAGRLALVPAGDAVALRAALKAAIESPSAWRHPGEGRPSWTKEGVVAAHIDLYQEAVRISRSRVAADRAQP